MKKIYKFLFGLSLLGMVLSGCNKGGETPTDTTDKRFEIYQLAVADGYSGTYEEWLASIRGQDGKDGKDGHSPVVVIGDDGYWYIDGVNTGVKAQGEPGQDGQDGKDGKDGVDGQDGKDGVDGQDGKDGVDGQDGKDGTDGQNGKDGQNGNDGQPGKDGTSVLTGNGEPSADLGQVGDSYINLDNWDYFVKSENGWQLKGNIKGSAGQDGQNGTNGTNGQNGENGKSVLIGSGAPLANVGEVGDSYIDNLTWNFYWKTLNDGWTLVGNIQGASGQNGENGNPGQNGKSITIGNGEPNAQVGAIGDSYIDGDTWNLYVKEENGWQLVGNIKGANGENGTNGTNGENGQNGLSAYEIYKKYHAYYAGTEEEWINDLAAGNLNKTFTVTFNVGHGEAVSNKTVEYRNVLHDVPLAPVRPSHSGHWEVNGNSVDLSNFVFLENTTVNAVYDSSVFTISESTGDVYLYNGDETDIVIPEYIIDVQVKGVAEALFLGEKGKSITSVVFPDSMIRMEEDAISAATNLESITFGAGMTSIDPDWFLINLGKKVAFKNINVSPNNPNYTSVDGILYNKDCTKLIAYPLGRTETSFTVPNSVTSIGPRAFACARSLTTINLNNVTVLDAHALESCVNLKNVISNKLETVNENAFGATSIESITFPDSVTFIAEHNVFSQCWYLEEVILGSGAPQIYVSNFIGCDAFDVSSLGNQLLYHHKNTWEHDDNHTHHWHEVTDYGYQDVQLDYGECNYQETFVDPTYEADGYHIIACETCGYESYHEDFTKYDTRALDCIAHLTLELYNGDTEYKVTAFDDAIETLYIPRVYNGKPVTQIGYLAIYNKDNVKNIIIPGSIRLIETQAFSGCDSLESVYMFEGIETISYRAFSSCKKLESAIIPDSVTSLGGDIYYGCNSLDYTVEGVLEYAPARSNPHKILTNVTDDTATAYTIDDECEFIDGSAFYGCDNLETIDIPASVKTIGIQTFGSCDALTTVTLHEGLEVLDNAAFERCPNLATISTLPSTLNKIGAGVFGYCTNLTSLSVSENNQIFEEYEGAIYKKLEGTSTALVCFPAGQDHVQFKNHVYEIADSAFYGCTKLTSIVIPGSVHEVGTYIFDGCSNLTQVTLSFNCTYISAGMFHACTKLESLTLDDCVTEIGNSAFSGCTHFTTLTMAYPGLTKICSYAFNGTALNYIFYGDTQASWNAIEKQGGWNSGITVNDGIIRCDDGNINIVG